MKKRLYLLQGLPMAGANIANKLLERFGSIEKVIFASVDELMEVDGIGKGKALEIR
jgi:ERCC4-type nuclease